MHELVVKIPEGLEREMSNADWVNWEEVAKEAFSERVEDIKELELKMKAAEISGIPLDDNREVRKELADDVVKSIEETLRSEKPMTLEEFNKWCDEL